MACFFKMLSIGAFGWRFASQAGNGATTIDRAASRRMVRIDADQPRALQRRQCLVQYRPSTATEPRQ